MAFGIFVFLMDKAAVITLIPFAVILYLKDLEIFDIKPNAFIFLNILVTLFLTFYHYQIHQKK